MNALLIQNKIAVAEEHKTPRNPRPDGEHTRAILLEIAGQLFAQKGYAAVSSKEVCQLANMNMASVNYHFLNKEGLYLAVLTEADNRVISQQQLKELYDADTQPLYKLEQIMLFVMRRIQEGAQSWHFQVHIREIMNPSGVSAQLVGKLVKPKLRLLRRLMGQILQLPPHHAKVQEALAACMSPCLLWLVGTPELRKQLLPALERRKPQQVEQIVAFSLSGLKAYMALERVDV